MLKALRKLTPQLIVPLIVVGGCALWLWNDHRDVKRIISQVEVERASYRENDEIAWAETADTVDSIYDKLEFWQEPLTLGDWHHLRRAFSYLSRRLRSSARNPPLSRDQRLSTLKYLARVSFAIRQFSEAERALREIISLAESGTDSDITDRQLLMLKADACNWLSCLLANCGDVEEGSIASQKSTEIALGLLTNATDNGRVQMAVALSLRNGGVIEELLERDGAVFVERAADAAEKAIAEPETMSLYQRIRTFAFLADTHQMAGFIHSRRGRFDLAETAWRKSRVFCERLVSVIGRGTSAADRVPSHRRILKAVSRLDGDLRLLRQLRAVEHSRHVPMVLKRGVSFSGGDNQDLQWQWDPLMAGDGMNLLAIDRLITGVLPGEFEPQDAIMVSWHSQTWSEPTLVKMIAAMQETTQIVVLVRDDEVREDAVEQLESAGIGLDNISFSMIDTDTVWCRDYGPLVVRCDDGAVRVARSMFTESFADTWVNNDALPHRWSRVTGWPMFQLPVLVEAGALLSNGVGLCIASTRLLAKNAASGIKEVQVTAALKRLTGATDVVYLEPIRGEPTGHVDWFAVFTSPTTVVIGDYYGIDEENTRVLDENVGRLRGISTPYGPLQVERIPMPPHGDDYFGGTYTNVVFANGNLLVPSWPEASKMTEEKALAVYRRLLPGWRIIPLSSRDFGRKNGSLHCATMNLYRHRPHEFFVREDS